MNQKIGFSIFLMFMLAFCRLTDAQSLQKEQSGTISVKVMCNSQLTVDKINQPLHFIAIGNVWRDTKHVKINGNCQWSLRIVTNKFENKTDDRNDDREHYNEMNNKSGGKEGGEKENNKNNKSDDDNKNNQNSCSITYSFKNISGTGRLLNPNQIYILGSSSQNLQSGIGQLEFDVVFEMILANPQKNDCGNHNTWVSFYLLPKE